MATPRLTGNDFAPTHGKLREEIDEALEELPELFVRYFFSITRERGQELQKQFRMFQKRRDTTATFSDYVYAVIMDMPLTKALSPEGCVYPKHPAAERALALMPYTPKAAVLEAGLELIYFGQGEEYEEVRKHRCSHCSVSHCRHSFAFRSDS